MKFYYDTLYLHSLQFNVTHTPQKSHRLVYCLHLRLHHNSDTLQSGLDRQFYQSARGTGKKSPHFHCVIHNIIVKNRGKKTTLHRYKWTQVTLTQQYNKGPTRTHRTSGQYEYMLPYNNEMLPMCR